MKQRKRLVESQVSRKASDCVVKFFGWFVMTYFTSFRPLSDEQMRYAAIDAIYLPFLAAHLREQLITLDSESKMTPLLLLLLSKLSVFPSIFYQA